MNILGVMGPAGSGKDTLADYICQSMKYRFHRVSLADPLKEFCSAIFGWDRHTLWGPSEERNKVDPDWGVSPRVALQTLGTEWGRKLHEDLWIKYGLTKALDRLRFWPGVVIPDCRFANEFKAIQQVGGRVVRLKRAGADGSVGIVGHASEREQQTIPDSALDYTIEVAEGHEAFYAQIDEMMKNFGFGSPTR